LRRRIFKQKKGFANLSLGLNYHSKALPQPPSRDTATLIQAVLIVMNVAQSAALISIAKQNR
jgi:hypothetical protein